MAPCRELRSCTRHVFDFACRQLDAERLEIEVAVAALGNHLGLAFLDLWGDLLAEQGHFGIDQAIAGLPPSRIRLEGYLAECVDGDPVLRGCPADFQAAVFSDLAARRL